MGLRRHEFEANICTKFEVLKQVENKEPYSKLVDGYDDKDDRSRIECLINEMLKKDGWISFFANCRNFPPNTIFDITPKGKDILTVLKNEKRVDIALGICEEMNDFREVNFFEVMEMLRKKSL